jgi:hypothetical protein|nr:CHRD domain-containing protein [Candidatus Krumholzibacteria bacterium]
MATLLNTRRLLLIGALATLLFAVPALADSVFECNLTEDQVAPASGSTAFGHAVLVLNNAETEIAYTLNFAGLDAAQTGAAFFIGAPGTNGTEVMSLPVGNPQSGMWAVTPEIADALMADELYIVVFSDSEMFPNGEIRGNFTLTIVSDEETSLGQVKALFR